MASLLHLARNRLGRFAYAVTRDSQRLFSPQGPFAKEACAASALGAV